MSRFQSWATPGAVLFAGLLIAASILFVGRWQITADAYGYMDGDTASDVETVYRLDRWTGRVDRCGPDMERIKAEGTVGETCPFKVPQ